jgi:hypothetical protein
MLKVASVGLSLSKLCAIASCFLPLVNAAFAEDIGASLSDGKPWSMVTEDGQSGQLTLVPGGKGKMKSGPMGMAFNVLHQTRPIVRALHEHAGRRRRL